MRTAIQAYTLRQLDEPLARTIERIGETPLDAVEMGVDGATDDEIRLALETTGLDVPAIGVGLDQLEEIEETVVPGCRAVGTDLVVLGYLGPEHFETAAAVDETADLVSAYADVAADHGLDFLYHNHAHEFVELGDGTIAFERFLDRVDDRVRFELDLGWVGTGGQDPGAWLERLSDRTPIVHVKDMHFDGDADFAALGEGDLDVDGTLAIAHEYGVEWAIYEHDEPADPVEALQRDSQRLVDAVDRTNPVG